MVTESQYDFQIISGILKTTYLYKIKLTEDMSSTSIISYTIDTKIDKERLSDPNLLQRAF